MTQEDTTARNTSDVTRWGVVGTGWIAARTLPDLQRTENVEVVAVSSRNADTAATFAGQHGIARPYGDYAELLADPGVDVVYICTPHGSHFSMTKAAIEAGRHVLCEKPLTLTAHEARGLAALAQARGVFLMEAMWTKFNPTIQRLRETVASGAIGELRYVQASFGFPAPRDSSSRFWDPEQGGGALLDLGVYPITMAHLFMGKPAQVSVLGSILANGVDTAAMMTLGSGDVVAQAATSIVQALPATATVAGTSGYVIVEAPFWCPSTFQIYPQGAAPGAPPPETVTVEQEGFGYVPMFRAVSAAVLAGVTESAVHPLSATIEVLDTVDEVRQRLLDAQHPGLGPITPWHEDAAPGE